MTDLPKCECGGYAHPCHFPYPVARNYCVECGSSCENSCGASTPYYPTRELADAAWTRMMAKPEDTTMMTDEQIKHMVNRFLQWKLPADFCPDGGVSFDPVCNKGTPHEYTIQTCGTHLLNARQAEAMVRFMLEGLKP